MGNTAVALNSDSVVRRSEGLLEAQVDGEVVALNVEKGTCYGLNKVGTRVWEMIAEPKRVGDVCASLVGEYAIAPEICEAQVLELLEELRGEGLVHLVQPDAP